MKYHKWHTNGVFIVVLCAFSTTQAGSLFQAPTIDSSKWTTPVLDVCWESALSEFTAEKGWVQQAILETWSKYSGVSFQGWDTCQTTSNGIRLQIADKMPQLKALGQKLSGVKNGVVLNFMFSTFLASTCSAKIKRKSCIEAEAVHEFGHVLGFAHPNESTEFQGRCNDILPNMHNDLKFPRYDAKSIMSFCTKNWNGDGRLSQSDIEGVQKWYGAPGFYSTQADWFQIQRPASPENYSIGSVWVAGDFDGDKITDLMHTDPKENSIHLWTFLRNGSLNQRVVKLPLFVKVGEGTWLTGNFDGNGKADLAYIPLAGNTVHTLKSLENGQFSIRAFSPSPDYRVELGTFLAGDFNGDGKTDLLHIVKYENLNYLHPWMSLGNGTFDVGKVCPPSPGQIKDGNCPPTDYSLVRGSWVAADFNGDKKTDLIHIVAGTNYFHPWRSLGNGQFTVDKFSTPLQYQYQVGLGSFLAADFNGDGKTDLVHLVNELNYLHTWKSLNDGQFEIAKVVVPGDYGATVNDGSWVAGDFNGDGKVDLLHFVASTNLVRLWISQVP